MFVDDRGVCTGKREVLHNPTSERESSLQSPHHLLHYPGSHILFQNTTCRFLIRRML